MTTVIDVRTHSEFVFGHKPGAINFDLQKLISGELPDVPKDQPIEVYCASGARSCLAAQILTQHGYTDVTDAGGYGE